MAGTLRLMDIAKKTLENICRMSFGKKTFPNYDNREEKLIGFIGGPPCPDFSTAGKK